ncbi:MAG TPA: type II secretion system protein [Thermoanaerobaculia bacterium]|nr:type II secretion system protein [Thermoanaerobaculia bacterium]
MSPTRTSDSERGFTLAGLIVILTIIMIFVTYTVTRQWSAIMQRDRERQTIFVMKQYARSINDFAKAKGNPVKLDQIKEARLPRYIRGPKGEYVDPLTGKVDWILVPAGAVTRTVDPVTGKQTTNFNGAASPKDYVGPFVGVRPPVTGKAYISLNGADTYETWVYTVQDLQNEIALKANQPQTGPGPGLNPPPK